MSRFRSTAALAATLAAACAPAAAPAPAPTAPPRIAALCAGARDTRWVDCVLGRLTLRQKAAQMVWPQLYGDYQSVDASDGATGTSWRKLDTLVRQDQVGGVIMSVGSPTEIAEKLNTLQRLSDLPLVVSGDLESGAAFRARGGYFLPNAIDLGDATQFPPQMAIGATGDTTLAYEMGRITAEEGRALGWQVAFAPVLDVNNNPANPVINTRSFGEDPHAVARLGAAFIRGVQEHGMIATGKHFPGHGDTGVNSHLALPVVNVSRARLDTVELVPFRAAIASGVGAIMTFHGAMPALDSSGVPGTLSHDVLSGLLRDELGFGGLVVTDAMDMRGVLVQFGVAEATKRAVAAGADVLLQPANAGQTIDAIIAGVAEGRYDERRIDASARRILALKQRLGLDRRRLVDLDSIRWVVGDSAHRWWAQLAAERSITLVRDSLQQLPLGRLNAGARVLSVTYARRPELYAGTMFDAELRRRFGALRSEWVDVDAPTPDFVRLLPTADSADVVLVSSYVAASSTQTTAAAPRAFADFVQELVRRGRHPILLSFGNPYLLQQVPDVSAYVVAWGPFPISQRAAARAVLGAIPISGRLPIAIPGLAALGAGESRASLASAAPSPVATPR